MARTVLLNLLGVDNTGRAFRSASREADGAADSVDRLDGSHRRSEESASRSEESHGRLSSTLARLAPAAGQAAASIGTVAAGLGAAIPAAAGLAATLIAIAPAAAVAATGIAAVGLAGAALKIGMAGVNDAVAAALDPSNPEAYAAALKKLSPAAASFVGEIHKLQPAFAGIKTAVQDTLFQGLDKSFANAARTTLPVFREGLVGAAQALNGMGKNLLSTIQGLGKSGALKTMFDGAVAGLKPLERIPGQLLKGFVQLGAAAAPIFARMTTGIGNAVTKVSDSLSGAFKSGALSGAINTAVGLLKELGGVAGNVFKIVQNIFGAAQATGGGTIGVLKTITGELAKITGTPAFQQGLQALFGVMNNLATTAAPLLGQALAAIAPVLTALAPAANALIAALGQALQPVIAALGPVLVAVAQAVGQLVIALAPLLPVIGQLIAALLPVLVPVFQLITTVLIALTPVIATVAQALTTYLVPVINTVVGVVTTVVNWIKAAAEQAFPALASAVTSAGGPLAGLKDALVNLWGAIQPLVGAIGNLIAQGFEVLRPYLPIVGDALKEVAKIFVEILTWAINNVVIPAINGLTALLKGDATASLRGWGQTVDEVNLGIIRSFQALPAQTTPALNQMVNGIATAARQVTIAVGTFVLAVRDAADEVFVVLIGMTRKMVTTLIAGGPPLRAAGVTIGKALLAGLNVIAPELVWAAKNWIKGMTGILSATVPTMFAIGKSLIAGLASGITSQLGALWSQISGIGSRIGSAFRAAVQSHSPSRMTMAIGVDVADGLGIGITEGIDRQIPKIKKKLGEVAVVFQSAFGEGAISLVPIGDLGKQLRQALTKGADEIASVVKEIRGKIADAFKAKSITANQRDDLLDYLATTNKKLLTLAKERQAVVDKIKQITDYAAQITKSVLSYAAITNIKGTDNAAPTGGQLVAGLQARLATIREFGANIKKLAGAGLSKALLGQILDAGIDGGAAIAAELANGPSSIIAALNTAQTQITKIAKGIGIDGADALFGSGKAMGDAFLKGLKSLEKALTDTMEALVEKLLKALGNGVDKAKGKLAEMAETSAKLTELAVTATQLGAYDPGPQPKAPTPLKTPTPAPAPKAPGGRPDNSKAGPKPVTINMGGVNVHNGTDIEALTSRISFVARSVSF